MIEFESESYYRIFWGVFQHIQRRWWPYTCVAKFLLEFQHFL